MVNRGEEKVRVHMNVHMKVVVSGSQSVTRYTREERDHEHEGFCSLLPYLFDCSAG